MGIPGGRWLSHRALRAGFSTRQAAILDVQKLRSGAAASAIFDPLGNLVIGEPSPSSGIAAPLRKP
ncbi:hypothetical protein AX767_03345 [Variovorax sp. PAMC 28711]|nr:hypothetical protein AX767_03345 [Variovorax sp. PAMC 28711]